MQVVSEPSLESVRRLPHRGKIISPGHERTSIQTFPFQLLSLQTYLPHWKERARNTASTNKPSMTSTIGIPIKLLNEAQVRHLSSRPCPFPFFFYTCCLSCCFQLADAFLLLCNAGPYRDA